MPIPKKHTSNELIGVVNPTLLPNSPTVQWLLEDIVDPGRLLTSVVNRPIKTNETSGYTDKTYDALRDIVTSKASALNSNYTTLINDSVPYHVNVSGKDYTKNYAGTTSTANSLWDRLFSSKGQIETTLGSFGADIYPQGIIVTDVYDYQTSHLANPGSPYGVIRNAANYVATPDYEPLYKKTPVVLYIPNSDASLEDRGKLQEKAKKYKQRMTDRQNKERELYKSEQKKAELNRNKENYNKTRNYEFYRSLDGIMNFFTNLFK